MDCARVLLCIGAWVGNRGMGASGLSGCVWLGFVRWILGLVDGFWSELGGWKLGLSLKAF